MITAEEARAIAAADAAERYRDLSVYRVLVREEGAVFVVEYVLDRPGWQGGGPSYAIQRADGAIVRRRYEQ